MEVVDDTDTITLHELLESTGLEQHVTIPTHIGKHTLDLIITRLSDELAVSTPWTEYHFSNHMLVHCKFKVSKPAFKRSQISFRTIKSINTDILREELSDTNLCKNLLSHGLGDLVTAYNDMLLPALDCHAPTITKTITKRPTVPWFNQEVKSAKKGMTAC